MYHIHAWQEMTLKNDPILVSSNFKMFWQNEGSIKSEFSIVQTQIARLKSIFKKNTLQKTLSKAIYFV